ncbi:hypothetical protein KSS87_012652 [Heliosperma pusillum]|nr:hypothetical protein KSS87_012652 [Heliosperma pusillum]
MSCVIKTLLSRSYPHLKPFKNPYESLLNNPIHKSWFNFFSTQVPNLVSYPTEPQKSRKNKGLLDVVSKEESLESFTEENGELKKKLLVLEMEIRQLEEEYVGFLNEIGGIGKGNDEVLSWKKKLLDLEIEIRPLKEENVGFLKKIEEEGKGKDGIVSNPKMETLESFSGENGEMEKKLWDLKMKIRQLKVASSLTKENAGSLKKVEGKGNGKNEVVSKPKSKTWNEVKKVGSSVELGKEISQDMRLLLRHLYDCGYFNDVHIYPGNKFRLSSFYVEFAHDYVKRALQKFGIDNQEISKWLSVSDAKSVALFGCPSLNNRDISAAKHLRSFFQISEESVCSKCVLNDTCKYRIARKCDISTLRLDSLLRVLRAYSLEDVSPKLELTDDMKACVSRLIQEVIKYSKGVDEVAADGGVEAHP